MNNPAEEISREALTETIAYELEAQFELKQMYQLQIPEIAFGVLRDLQHVLSTEHVYVDRLISSINVSGRWTPISQVDRAVVVSLVSDALENARKAYDIGKTPESTKAFSAGCESLSNHQVAGALKGIMLSDLYMKTYANVVAELDDSVRSADLTEGDQCTYLENRFFLSAKRCASVSQVIQTANSEIRSLVATMMQVHEGAFRQIIRPYLQGGIEDDDRLAEGRDGFFRACVKFNPRFNKSFYSFLQRWVVQRTVMHIDTFASALSVTKTTGSTHRAIKRAKEKSEGNGSVIGLKALSRRAGCTIREMEDIKQAYLGPAQIYTGVGADDNGPSDRFEIAGDNLTPDVEFALTEMNKVISSLFGRLSDREAYVVASRYGIGCREQTLEQIGKTLNLTLERVRQIQKAAEASMLRIASEDGYSLESFFGQ